MDKTSSNYLFEYSDFHKIIKYISNIENLNCSYLANLNNFLKQDKQKTLYQTITSSQKLEGRSLSIQDIERQLSPSKKDSLKTPNIFVENYFKALNFIHKRTKTSTTTPLTCDSIVQLNELLCEENSLSDSKGLDLFRKNSKEEIDISDDKVQHFIFKRKEFQNGESELVQLMRALEKDLFEEEIHPLIVIGVYSYQFLQLSPFKKYNGKTFELLIELLLLQQGYSLICSSSFLESFEKTNREYFQAIMTSQDETTNGYSQYRNWVLYFLNTLSELNIESPVQIKEKTIENSSAYINPRQKKLANYIQKNEPLKISDLAAQFDQINYNTLKKDLQYLKQTQSILSVGNGKGTVYYHKKI